MTEKQWEQYTKYAVLRISAWHTHGRDLRDADEEYQRSTQKAWGKPKSEYKRAEEEAWSKFLRAEESAMTRYRDSVLKAIDCIEDEE